MRSTWQPRRLWEGEQLPREPFSKQFGRWLSLTLLTFVGAFSAWQIVQVLGYCLLSPRHALSGLHYQLVDSWEKTHHSRKSSRDTTTTYSVIDILNVSAEQPRRIIVSQPGSNSGWRVSLGPVSVRSSEAIPPTSLSSTKPLHGWLAQFSTMKWQGQTLPMYEHCSLYPVVSYLCLIAVFAAIFTISLFLFSGRWTRAL